MNYDGLPTSYWESQIERIMIVRDRIAGAHTVQVGRVMPSEDDLAIGTGKRLSMAVLFLDISDFSQRTSETEEQQGSILKVLNLFFTEMIKIAEEYGGTVEKNTGDGLMAYFEDGGGTPPVGGAKRALACALTMMAANDFLIRPILEATPLPEIKFRVSIDYGNITVARLGAARRFNANVAIGATANFACKMLRHAAPGEIVLGATVLLHIPHDWLQFTELMDVSTGWSYLSSRIPYRLYRYKGRWARLI